MVPNARFNELLTDLEPSRTTTANAASAHFGVRDHLRDHERFSNRWVSDFLAGSYARDTAIRPRTTADGQERPDVDIIVVTNFSTLDTPDAVLNEVCDALEDGYEVERINKRSVRVTTWNAEMDIVPVIQFGTGYQIPDRDTGQWRFTNPPAHGDWSTAQNAAFEGRFKRLVKMTKGWRRENPSGKRPKGFALEMLVAMHAPRNETHFGEAFARMLEGIHATYAAQALAGRVPFIGDPAISSNNILEKVSLPQWRDFLEKVRVYAGYAREAQSTDDMERATQLWRWVFGERFRPTATAAKAADASTIAEAPPTAPGYSFPNANAAPSTPRGFA